MCIYWFDLFWPVVSFLFPRCRFWDCHNNLLVECWPFDRRPSSAWCVNVLGVMLLYVRRKFSVATTLTHSLEISIWKTVSINARPVALYRNGLSSVDWWIFTLFYCCWLVSKITKIWRWRKFLYIYKVSYQIHKLKLMKI